MANKVNKIEDQSSLISFDQMCQMYVRVFKVIAVLPFEGRDSSFVGSYLLACYFFISSHVHWLSFTVYCFTTNSVQLEDICLAIMVIGLNYRFNAMLFKRKGFAAIYNECRLLWNFCDPQGQRTVLFFEQKIRRAYKIFLTWAILINIMYPVDALITRLPPLEPNGTERRILPFSWFADNTENVWPGYWPNFVLQIVLVQNSIVYTLACDTAIPLLVMISSGYFKHLGDRLSCLHDSPNSTKLEHLRCIYFHQRLLLFCSKLTKFADTILFTQVLSTGYNISLILIKLVSNDSDKYKYLPTVVIFVLQLFLIQWAPDHLHDESEGVAHGAYAAYVSSMGSGLHSDYLTLIGRAQRPVQIVVGGVVPLSLESFGNMMKSAFSFFTILRNLEF